MKRILSISIILVMIFSGFVSAENVQEKEYSAPPEYHISVNDVIEISVYEEKDLSKTVRVSNDGTITYPLLGTISVLGLTPQQLERKLTELLEKDYLVNPMVNVFIKEYAKVFVMGQVKKPGAYELKAGMTAVQAIAIAGGMSELASPNGTKVIRKRGGKERVFNIPVDSILKSGDRSRDVTLEPNDTVVVPESFL
ncbi:MAG: polysaccharide export protein [Candidatus Omnitrophica bacterium]|nr:polysaccharide export protein [Candidatus Omnitrophota bacterium]